jgi:hypothetical protein
MFITNHVLSGALIGLAAPRRPAKVALAAAGRRFVRDSMPHWGIRDDQISFRKVAIVDGLLGPATIRAVVAAVPCGTRVAVLAGMLGAALPDADKPMEVFFGRSPFPPASTRSTRRFNGNRSVAFAPRSRPRWRWPSRCASWARCGARHRGRPYPRLNKRDVYLPVGPSKRTRC